MSEEKKTVLVCEAKGCRTKPGKIPALFRRDDGAKVCPACNALAVDAIRERVHAEAVKEAAEAEAAKPAAAKPAEEA